MGEPITIVNEGGWPRLSNSRITIFDLFPFFRDGEDYETILRWMPTLSREALMVAEEFIRAHRTEIEEAYRRDQEETERRSAAQKALGGIYAAGSIPLEKRLPELHLMMDRLKAVRNGAHDPAR
jgi:hypothetical protein